MKEIMTKKLFFNAVFKVISGVILVELLIFLPAGTLGFRFGWSSLPDIVVIIAKRIKHEDAFLERELDGVYGI